MCTGQLWCTVRVLNTHLNDYCKVYNIYAIVQKYANLLYAYVR